MNFIKTHKKWCALALGIIIVIGAAAAVSAAVIQSRNAKEVTAAAENTERESQAVEAVEYASTEAETEISEEEYYEEELALDDSDENVEYEEKDKAKEKTEDFPYYISVNRQMNTVTIYSKDENGEYKVPIKAMVCSCGLNGGTPLGVFKTSTKYTWRALYGNVYGQYAYRINGPIMFHSVPYYTTDKWNLESEEYNKLGDFASLGCVRLSVRDAKWLVDNCPSGTTVEIYDSPDPGPLGKPSAAWIDLNSPCRGWDPTDPDPANPWSTTGPTIACAASITVERGSAVDTMYGVSAAAVTGEAVAVTASGTVNTDMPGTYDIYYSATDSRGNTSTAATQYIVVDTTKPTISSKGDLYLADGSFDSSQLDVLIKNQVTVSDGNYSATAVIDDSDYAALSSAVQNKTGGSYAVRVHAADDSGNVSDDVVVNVIYTCEAPQPGTETSGTEVPGTEVTGTEAQSIGANDMQ